MLKKPFITEKSMRITGNGLYTFLVDNKATKNQVAKIVSEKFKVDVLAVKTINVSGKTKPQRSRKGYYTKKDLKKAIVKLKDGQKIALFESPEDEKEEVEIRTAEGESLGKVKEKKSLLRGTKVRIEKNTDESKVKKGKEKGDK